MQGPQGLAPPEPHRADTSASAIEQVFEAIIGPLDVSPVRACAGPVRFEPVLLFPWPTKVCLSYPIGDQCWTGPVRAACPTLPLSGQPVRASLSPSCPTRRPIPCLGSLPLPDRTFSVLELIGPASSTCHLLDDPSSLLSGPIPGPSRRSSTGGSAPCVPSVCSPYFLRFPLPRRA